MLEKLYIENVAVIERAEIDFSAGFNILTGETGSGKSIIIDSLNLLLGQRASRDLIRTGESRAYVSGTFSMGESYALPVLRESGIEPDDSGNILIERTIGTDGKGTARIGGRPVPLSLLRDLGPYLIAIHGQHLNQRILNPDLHIQYVDGYGNYDPLLAEYQAIYRELSACRRELQNLQRLETDKAERQEMYAFHVQELEAAELREGEEEELLERRQVAAHAEKIEKAAFSAIQALSEDDGAILETMERIGTELERAGEYSSKLKEAAAALASARPGLEDCVELLRDAANQISYSPGELDRIENRLAELKRIKTKYGGTIESAIATLEKEKKALSDLEFSEENLQKAQARFAEIGKKLTGKAEALTKARHEAGERLSHAVMETLAFLDMQKCTFAVQITPSEKYSLLGHDHVEFFLSANPGEAPKPLAKIASGGELSRIMLALIHVLSEKDKTDTAIFDEVDTGVSGATAQKIGVLLKRVSRKMQVLCVTHLPQIAAMADRHLFISKSSDGAKTFTRVEALDEAARRKELARIIGGTVISESTLKTADELILEGKKI